MTLKLYGVRVGESQCGNINNTSDLLKDAFHLSQTRAAIHLLSKMRDRLTEDMRTSQDRAPFKGKESSSSSVSSNIYIEEFPSSISSEDIAVDVASHCLFKHVEHQLQFGGKFICHMFQISICFVFFIILM